MKGAKNSLAPYDIRKQFADEAGELPDDINMQRVSGDIVCNVCGKMYYQHPQDWRTAHKSNDYFPWLVVLCDGVLGKL